MRATGAGGVGPWRRRSQAPGGSARFIVDAAKDEGEESQCSGLRPTRRTPIPKKRATVPHLVPVRGRATNVRLAQGRADCVCSLPAAATLSDGCPMERVRRRTGEASRFIPLHCLPGLRVVATPSPVRWAGRLASTAQHMLQRLRSSRQESALQRSVRSPPAMNRRTHGDWNGLVLNAAALRSVAGRSWRASSRAVRAVPTGPTLKSPGYRTLDRRLAGRA
jgi:hypothetical protein